MTIPMVASRNMASLRTKTLRRGWGRGATSECAVAVYMIVDDRIYIASCPGFAEVDCYGEIIGVVIMEDFLLRR
jgi:hypothetical protein